jgi:hypothetical protein
LAVEVAKRDTYPLALRQQRPRRRLVEMRNLADHREAERPGRGGIE